MSTRLELLTFVYGDGAREALPYGFCALLDMITVCKNGHIHWTTVVKTQSWLT